MGRAHSPEPQTWLSDELVQGTSKDSSQEWEDRAGGSAGERIAMQFQDPHRRRVHLLTLLRAGLGLLWVTEANQSSHGPKTVPFINI